MGKRAQATAVDSTALGADAQATAVECHCRTPIRVELLGRTRPPWATVRWQRAKAAVPWAAMHESPHATPLPWATLPVQIAKCGSSFGNWSVSHGINSTALGRSANSYGEQTTAAGGSDRRAGRGQHSAWLEGGGRERYRQARCILGYVGKASSGCAHEGHGISLVTWMPFSNAIGSLGDSRKHWTLRLLQALAAIVRSLPPRHPRPTRKVVWVNFPPRRAAAVGTACWALTENATSVGYFAQATGERSSAFGSDSHAAGDRSTASGRVGLGDR